MTAVRQAGGANGGVRSCKVQLAASAAASRPHQSAASTGVRPAADVHDLIGALSYKQVNLYGVSYGTRLALATRRGEW
jgi:pimeloyl-ACP methyl ester carboxylesterase